MFDGLSVAYVVTVLDGCSVAYVGGLDGSSVAYDVGLLVGLFIAYVGSFLGISVAFSCASDLPVSSGASAALRACAAAGGDDHPSK